MRFGLHRTIGHRVEPKPGLLATCPCCEADLISKCGSIRIHHWAHKSGHDCDHWWENETEWHRKWKNRFPEEWQEIVKQDEVTGEKHIADIYNSKRDLVIEFQNSPIDPKEMYAREKFYKRMLWVVNAESFYIFQSPLDKWDRRLQKRLEKIGRFDYREQIADYKNRNERLTASESYFQYTWGRRRKVWDSARQPVFLDLGKEIVWIRSYFIGQKVPLEKFMEKYRY